MVREPKALSYRQCQSGYRTRRFESERRFWDILTARMKFDSI